MNKFNLSKTFFFSIFLLIGLLSSVETFAAPGDLDQAFGTGGISNLNDAANCFNKAVRIQSDGKILVARNCGKIQILRFDSNGRLDTTYGTNGIIDVVASDNTSEFLEFQNDDKLVAVRARYEGYVYADFRRFNTNGTIDTTFGNGGVITRGCFQTCRFRDLAVHPDGTIVAVGEGFQQFGTTYFPLMLGIKPDGTDISFSSPFFPGAKSALKTFIQPDGKILVSGSNGTKGYLIRYNANGTFDAIDNNAPFWGFDLQVQTDGKTVISGAVNFATANAVKAIARYNPNLTLDSTFGYNGLGLMDVNENGDGGYQILIQRSNSIIVGGSKYNNPSSGSRTQSLVRFLKNGQRDTGFGPNGLVADGTPHFSDEPFLVLDNDDKILAVGLIAGSHPFMNSLIMKRYTADPTVAQNRSRFDFDGDRKSDVSVFRPDTGNWYIQQSTAGFTGLAFGIASDKLVPADYDGDGKTDVAIYRNGNWYLQRSAEGFAGVLFGTPEDIPVPADYDGDGKADLAVFRPSNGVWYLLQSADGFTGIRFGQTDDKPVAADYNGDGKTDIAVYRGGNWYIRRGQFEFTAVAFGAADDKLVPADYDGDGKTDIAVFRPSNGTWYLQQSSGGFAGVQFGTAGDLPTAADYDGDGKSDLAVVRNGVWYINRSQAGFTGIQFGTATDKPIPNTFVR